MQRLVVYSGAEPPEDANVVATLPDIERSAGAPVVHEGGTPDYSKAGKTALLSHGAQGTIGWKGGTWNGARLVDDELLGTPARALKAGTELELWSCSAGERKPLVNDSLVDAVRTQLTVRGVAGVTVRGVKGGHIVLNDQGDHYVPDTSVNEDVFVETFLCLRAYYLWLFGFLSNEIVRKDLGGLEQKRVGVGPNWHPVLVPKNLDKTNQLLLNLRQLYNTEVLAGGVLPTLAYGDYVKGRIVLWQKMSSFLRTNRAFQAVTEKVEADWLELKS